MVRRTLYTASYPVISTPQHTPAKSECWMTHQRTNHAAKEEVVLSAQAFSSYNSQYPEASTSSCSIHIHIIGIVPEVYTRDLLCKLISKMVNSSELYYVLYVC